jgi:hypothetical protein
MLTQGRLAGLQRKLADIATLVFIDAPYVLPLWYKPAAADADPPCQQQPQHAVQKSNQPLAEQFTTQSSAETGAPPQQQLAPSCGLPAPKRAWLLSMDLLAAQPQLQVMFQQQQQQQQQEGVVAAHVQDTAAPASSAEAAEAAKAGWQVAPADVTTADQHSSQCYGWQASWQVLQAALSSNGLQQVDGLLGFSQGAAVVAAVAAELQRKQQQQQQQHTHVIGSSSPHVQQQQQLLQPRFAILASGFVSPAPEHYQLLQEQQPLQLPSLHVYAAAAENCSCSGDRQIQQQLSEELYQLWAPAARQRLLHDGGHLIPCRKDVVGGIRAFLQQFATDSSHGYIE